MVREGDCSERAGTRQARRHCRSARVQSVRRALRLAASRLARGKVQSLLNNADQAMYSAKADGRNRSRYFTASMQERAQTRMRLVNDLHLALDQNQFSLHFQPIVDLNDGRVVKAETLLRWHHPVRGLV